MTRTNQRRQHLIDGNGNAVPFSKNDDRLIEGSDFRGSPGFDVLKHAAGVFGGLFQHGPETRFKGWFVGQHHPFHGGDLACLAVDHHARIEQVALEQFTVG